MDSRTSDAGKSLGQYNSFNSTVICPGLRNYEERSRENAIDDEAVSVRTDRTKILKRRLLEKQKSQQYIDPDLESWRSERKPLLNLTSETARAFGARQAVFMFQKATKSYHPLHQLIFVSSRNHMTPSTFRKKANRRLHIKNQFVISSTFTFTYCTSNLCF